MAGLRPSGRHAARCRRQRDDLGRLRPATRRNGLGGFASFTARGQASAIAPTPGLPGARLNPLFYWRRLQESNPRPSDYKSAALPSELNRRADGLCQSAGVAARG